MGRGRAKAKQTKVARQLKYNSGGTDLNRLAEELGVSSADEPQVQSDGDDTYEDELDDPYAAYADYYDDDDDEDDAGPSGRR